MAWPRDAPRWRPLRFQCVASGPPDSACRRCPRSQIARVATAEEIDLAILRRMTPAEKLDVMQGLWRQAWALKAAGVRLQHSDWREDRVTAEVREIFRREPA